MAKKDQVQYVYRYHHWCLGIRTQVPYRDEDTDPSQEEDPETSHQENRTDPYQQEDAGPYQEEIRTIFRVDHEEGREEEEDDILVVEDLQDINASEIKRNI